MNSPVSSCVIRLSEVCGHWPVCSLPAVCLCLCLCLMSVPHKGLLHSVAFVQHTEHSIRKEEVILHRQRRVLQERIHFPDPTSLEALSTRPNTVKVYPCCLQCSWCMFVSSLPNLLTAFSKRLPQQIYKLYSSRSGS